MKYTTWQIYTLFNEIRPILPPLSHGRYILDYDKKDGGYEIQIITDTEVISLYNNGRKSAEEIYKILEQHKEKI